MVGLRRTREVAGIRAKIRKYYKCHTCSSWSVQGLDKPPKQWMSRCEDFKISVLFRWPRGLTCVWSWTSRTLGSWVPVPLQTYIMFSFFCVLLSCIGIGFVMCRSPIQGVLPVCLKGFTESELNFDSQHTKKPDLYKIQQLRFAVDKCSFTLL
jgi:hypothetical protein